MSEGKPFQSFIPVKKKVVEAWLEEQQNFRNYL